MSAARDTADLVVGPLTQTDLVRYQGASGDFNVIHHDGAGAAERRQRVISPGMYQAGLMDTWLARAASGAQVRRFAVRFLAPACVGDTLSISGAPVADDPATIEMTCRNDAGTVLVTGRATLAS
jgi:acyl dehydratase